MNDYAKSLKEVFDEEDRIEQIQMEAMNELYNRIDKVLKSYQKVKSNLELEYQDKYSKLLYNQLEYLNASYIDYNTICR